MPTIEEMKAFEATFIDYEGKVAILQELIEEQMAQNALDAAVVES